MFTASDVRPVPLQRRGALATQLSFEARKPSQNTVKVRHRYEELREQVKEKGKVRSPSAKVFSPKNRASTGDKVEPEQSQKLSGLCIQLEKFSMDTHNNFCMHLHFILWSWCWKNAGVQEIKHSELNSHQELHT